MRTATWALDLKMDGPRATHVQHAHGGQTEPTVGSRRDGWDQVTIPRHLTPLQTHLKGTNCPIEVGKASPLTWLSALTLLPPPVPSAARVRAPGSAARRGRTFLLFQADRWAPPVSLCNPVLAVGSRSCGARISGQILFQIREAEMRASRWILFERAGSV